MKLFILKRLDAPAYDEFDSMVVRAERESDARAVASNNSGDEGSVWQNQKCVTCEVLTSKGTEEFIIGSFNAG